MSSDYFQYWLSRQKSSRPPIRFYNRYRYPGGTTLWPRDLRDRLATRFRLNKAHRLSLLARTRAKRLAKKYYYRWWAKTFFPRE